MKAIKRAIILCWVMLIVCFIIKLFGGNWFEIICNNEHFINICSYIDTHPILRDSIASVLYIISSFFIISACAFLPSLNKKQVLVILIALIIVWATKYISLTTKSIVEAIHTVTTPIILNLMPCKEKSERTKVLKKTWYYGIIGYLFILIFQVISLITRNLGIKFIEDNSLLSMILMVDYYIMIALYYLYIKLKIKKEKK